MITANLTTYAKRKHPIKSGYRPLFLIYNEFYSGVISFDGVDIEQNETRAVEIDFVSYNGNFCKGEILHFYESPNFEIGEVMILGYTR